MIASAPVRGAWHETHVPTATAPRTHNRACSLDDCHPAQSARTTDLPDWRSPRPARVMYRQRTCGFAPLNRLSELVSSHKSAEALQQDARTRWAWYRTHRTPRRALYLPANACADRPMIGMSLVSGVPFSRRAASQPSMTGICRSIRIMSGRSVTAISQPL